MVIAAITTGLVHEAGEGVNWNAIVPLIFTDPRFQRTAQRRWVAQVDGQWVGVVVASRPSNRENFALNCEDLDRVIEKCRDGALDAGFVVLAALANSAIVYVDHREANAVRELLKNDPPRDGPHGPYWLLRGSFDELELLAEALKRL
jgi:hypothetical protein